MMEMVFSDEDCDDNDADTFPTVKNGDGYDNDCDGQFTRMFSQHTM